MSDSSFAPLNDNFDTNPDKKYIDGPYSTFDWKLSKMLRVVNDYKDKLDANEHNRIKRFFLNLIYLHQRNKMAKHAMGLISESKMAQHTGEIADIFIDVISQPEMRLFIKKFNLFNNKEKIKTANVILTETIDEINARYDINMPRVLVNRAKKSVQNFEAIAVDRRGQLYIEMCIHKNPPVSEFMPFLFHELVHSIDFIRPNFGPLGAQIVNAFRLVNFGEKDEELDPIEINAYIMQYYIQKYLDAIIRLDIGTPLPKTTEYTLYMNYNDRRFAR